MRLIATKTGLLVNHIPAGNSAHAEIPASSSVHLQSRAGGLMHPESSMGRSTQFGSLAKGPTDC